MRRIALALILAALPIGSAFAGSSTINVTPGSGATYNVITDGSGHFVGEQGICDGTAAAQCAAVKAASTAAGASDPSLVVGLSPNSLLPAFAATPTVNLGTIGGAATAANQASVIGTLAAGTSAANSLLTGGVFNTVAPTLTNGQQAAVQFDASGNTLVNVKTGTLVVTQSSGSSLHMVCDSGCIANLATDETAFSFGSSIAQVFGGVFQTTVTNNPLGNGQSGAMQMTAFRAAHMNLRNASGTEVGTAAAPLQVDGTNGTFPISAASLPLPTGAATSANQTASQTPVAPNTATATKGLLLGGQYNSTQTTFTNGQQGSLQTSSRGELLVTTGVNPVAVGGQAANAAVPVGNPVLVGGFDGTDVRYISTTNTGAVNINGSITASLGAYTPSGNTATLAVTSASARTALPSGSPATVVVYNTGLNNAFVSLGDGSVVATTADDVVSAGCWLGFATGTFVDIAAITASSTTSLVITGGTGLPTGGCSPVFSGTIATVNQGSPPWSMNLTALNSTGLGNPSNYGTSPGAVAVIGVNAFITNTTAVSVASGQIASGAIASGAVASGAIASGAVASGAYAVGSISDGAQVTLGAKADAKSTATDTTAITIMQVLKEISFMEQTPASRAVTNAGTFAVQATQSGNWTARVVGNGGATLDSTVGAGTAPANQLVVGALYNSTEISPTTGQAFSLQADSKGRLRGVIMDAAGNTRGANVNSSNQLSVSVDGSSATQTVTGSGSAGTAASGVVTVQGIASMTALLVNPGTIATWGLAAQGGATAPTNALAVAGVFNTTTPTLTNGQAGAVQLSARGGLLLGNGYPAGSTPITISGTGTTGATTATLATGASVTTYICGFSIRANANAAATGNATVTGTITGTLNFTQWTAPNASGLGVTEMIFTPCVPASAVNTGIAIISAAPGTGGVVSVTGWGYTL